MAWDSLQGWLRSVWESMPTAESEEQPHVPDVVEARCLARYCWERDIENLSDDEVISLVDAIQQYEGDNSKGAELVRAYRPVARASFAKDGINGRTILDSQTVGKFWLGRIATTAIASLLIAVAVKILANGVSPVDSPVFSNFLTVVEQIASPFFWGAVGACVYLMKRLSEYCAANQFDARKLQGVLARILLGAFMGIAFAHLFPVQDWARGAAQIVSADNGASAGTALPYELISSISRDAVAFLAGLGVKAFYGIAESLIEIIAWLAKQIKQRIVA